MAPVKGPSLIWLIVVLMATMLNHNHALGAMIAPVSIMVSVTTHFDTHTGTVTAIPKHSPQSPPEMAMVPSERAFIE